MKTETPRTDEAESLTLTPAYEFEGAEQEAWDFARQLERELNEADTDSKRLNWIMDNAVCYVNGQAYQSLLDREAIDAAMEAEK